MCSFCVFVCFEVLLCVFSEVFLCFCVFLPFFVFSEEGHKNSGKSDCVFCLTFEGFFRHWMLTKKHAPKSKNKRPSHVVISRETQRFVDQIHDHYEELTEFQGLQ